MAILSDRSMPQFFQCILTSISSVSIPPTHVSVLHIKKLRLRKSEENYLKFCGLPVAEQALLSIALSELHPVARILRGEGRRPDT